MDGEGQVRIQADPGPGGRPGRPLAGILSGSHDDPKLLYGGPFIPVRMLSEADARRYGVYGPLRASAGRDPDRQPGCSRNA